jgi:hypothetical protein
VHPYREAPPSSRRRQVDREQTIVHGALVAVGVIPVAIALATGDPLGSEATLGLLLVAAGLVGLVAGRRPR